MNNEKFKYLEKVKQYSLLVDQFQEETEIGKLLLLELDHLWNSLTFQEQDECRKEIAHSLL